MRVLIFFGLLFLAIFAHDTEKAHIYEPFPLNKNSPTPEEIKADEIQTDQIYIPENKHEKKHNQKQHKNKDDEKQDHSKQYQEFNEIFKVGMILGTILLAITLIHTCSSGPNPNRRQERRNQIRGNPEREISRIDHQIKHHEEEIKKLKTRATQIQKRRNDELKMRQAYEVEQRRAVEQYHRMRNNQINYYPQQINYYPQQINYYQRQVPQQMQMRRENIPVGRPLTNQNLDNNSSFASDYPTL